MGLLIVKLKKYYPIVTLIFLEVILFFTTYLPKTYLIGWDSLFPEFNFSLNIKRSVFSVWQEYRGLGLPDGMSFAANLPHYLFVFLLWLFLPENAVRYVFIFLMHLLGGIGMYVLSSKLLNNKIIPLLAALFYQYNFATIQMFYTPFELFAVHFAALPWLVWSVNRCLEKKGIEDFLLLAIISFFAAPQAHVPSLFLVSFLALAVVLFFNFLAVGRKILKNIFFVILVIVATNGFWALPYLYTGIHQASVIANSKINQMATEDIYRQNSAFGDLDSVVRLLGYPLGAKDGHPGNTDEFIMSKWRQFSHDIVFNIASLVFFTFAALGTVGIAFKKQKDFYPFIALFAFSFAMLGVKIPIVRFFSLFLRLSVPYFHQVFRYTFTKFSLLYVFSMSLLFAVGIEICFLRIANNKITRLLLMLNIFLLLLLYSFPIWQGNFIYPALELQIPKEYYLLMDFFKKQDEYSRVAPLPQTSFWGWTYTNWGYRGSGFMWFAIPQAMLDGAFYPWSRENENYYREFTTSLYSRDIKSLESVLEKYQISWIVVDGNAVSPTAPVDLYLNYLREMFAKSKKIQPVRQFGAITVYRVNLESKGQKFVFLADNAPVVGPSYEWGNFDIASYNNYVYLSNLSQSSDKKNLMVFYPFRSLFTGRKQQEHEFFLRETQDSFVFSNYISKDFKNGRLILPRLSDSENRMIYRNDGLPATETPLRVVIDGKLVAQYNLGEESQSINFPLSDLKAGIIEVLIPKIESANSYDSRKTGELFQETAANCDSKKASSSKSTVLISKEPYLHLMAANSQHCGVSIYLPDLSHELSYLIIIKSRYQQGKSLLFWLENLDGKHADIETYLEKKKKFHNEYFIQPPMSKTGKGYSLHFDNISIGDIKTVNDISRVRIYPIPYNFLTNMKIVVGKGNGGSSAVVFDEEIKVDHPNYSLYKVSFTNTNKINKKLREDATLVLSQSFDEGWKAFQIPNSKFKIQSFVNQYLPFLFGKEIREHVLVNNWANGWRLKPADYHFLQPTTIIIVYWPQYLQYLGFLLTFGSFGWLGVKWWKERKQTIGKISATNGVDKS